MGICGRSGNVEEGAEEEGAEEEGDQEEGARTACTAQCPEGGEEDWKPFDH